MLPDIGTSDLVYRSTQISLAVLSIYCSNKYVILTYIQLAKEYFCSLFIKKYFSSVIISTGDKVASMDLSFTSQFLGGSGAFAVKELPMWRCLCGFHFHFLMYTVDLP